MDIRVKIFGALPAFVKKGATHAYIEWRRLKEATIAHWRSLASKDSGEEIKVVYITGHPRSGTTVVKYFLGEYPGLERTEFNPAGFSHAWNLARQPGHVLVDKSNHYIYSAHHLFRAYGEAAALCCVIRDPRDSLVSIRGFADSREVPRDQRFWKRWRLQHERFFRFAETSGFGKRIFVVRYEDLVRFPRQAKHAFLNWLGFSSSLSELTNGYTVSHPGEGVHDSVHDHRQIKPIGMDRWKNDRHDAETTAVLATWKEDLELRKLMHTLGYDDDGLGTCRMEARQFTFFKG